jgi:hypothetical protein
MYGVRRAVRSSGWCRNFALAGPINQRKRGDETGINQEEPGISMDNCWDVGMDER